MRAELPTLAELVEGVGPKTELAKLLESEPPVEWLEDHDDTILSKDGKRVKYLPIERVDYLLRSIFTSYWWEVVSVGIFQNSTQVTGRLKYVDPISGRVQHSDGVGGASSKMGVEAAVAVAEANAKKSAAKKLGKIFGRDLSRDLPKEKQPEPTEVNTVEAAKEAVKNPVAMRIINQIRKTNNIDALRRINANVLKKVGLGQISDEDLEEITEEFNKKNEQ